MESTTLIGEIRNNTDFPVTVRNMEKDTDTAGSRGEYAPGEVRMLTDIGLAIPWCGDLESADFAKHHIRIDVRGRASFFIWQATHSGLDRVRVSTDGRWHKPGDLIGGFAAVGPIEELFGGKERTLVINDFTLWLLPIDLSNELKEKASEQGSIRLCGAPLDRLVPSVPKEIGRGLQHGRECLRRV